MTMIVSTLFTAVAAYTCHERAKIFGKLSSLALFAMIAALPLIVLLERVL